MLNRRSRRKTRKQRGGNIIPPKVAIFFVGRISGFEHTKINLLKIKNKFNPICFCSLNESTLTGNTKKFCELFDVTNMNEQVRIEKTVLPKSLVLKPNISLNPKNVYSMFYHQKHVMHLIEAYQKKHNILFDCVIYYRADIATQDDLNIHDLANNTVYIPHGSDSIGINDRMAYGNFEAMKKYTSSIDLINNMGVIELYPEVILKKNLDAHKLNVERIQYNANNLHPWRK
jgi:hypothetical protein